MLPQVPNLCEYTSLRKSDHTTIRDKFTFLILLFQCRVKNKTNTNEAVDDLCFSDLSP